jgi:response regulator RpfG family c-di-GMP phosphodiesterase
MADTTGHIFLVDDNLTNLNTGKYALQDKYKVVTIPSGVKLFQILQKLRPADFPDLILLDIKMPVMDGKGYPKGLKGLNIPLQARMMSFVDVYDALVSKRSYQNAFTHEEAMKIIHEGRSTQFDPDLTDIFFTLSKKLNEISKRR